MLHRERRGAELMPLGTPDDGGFHRFPLPSHVDAWTTKATLGDESDAATVGTPPPPYAPQLPCHAREQQKDPGHLRPGSPMRYSIPRRATHHRRLLAGVV